MVKESGLRLLVRGRRFGRCWRNRDPMAYVRSANPEEGGAPLVSRFLLAEFIGTTRETVTRTLSEFKSHHLIELRGSTLVIICDAANVTIERHWAEYAAG